MSQRPPNIVIFNPDQFRGDVPGYTGNTAGVTPVLDTLVETDAVAFRNTFCQNPVCVPSRCSFMTGWYPHTGGHRTMRHMLQPHDPMLLKTLKQNGYFVWWGGKNDVVPGQYGYEAYCDIKYTAPNTPDRPLRSGLHSWHEWRGRSGSDTFYSFYYGRIENNTGESYVYDHDWAMVEGAVEFIKSYDGDKPICIYLPLHFPHPPYAVEDPWYSQVDRDALPSRIPQPEEWSVKPSILEGLYRLHGMEDWTEDRWTELRATYYGSCARNDYGFGLVMEALKHAGIYDQTAVFFFSDHGDFTGDYGLVEKTENTFEDCLVNVPLVIKPPANMQVQPGVRDTLVELVDFPATVLDMAGIALSYTQFGRTLVPLFADARSSHRDAVFCQGGRIHGEQHIIASQEHPLGKKWFYYPRRSLQASEGPEHSKATMCRTIDHKYVQRLYEMDELYDLRLDPYEQHNLINDSIYAGVAQTLKDRLLRFYLETGDVVPFQLDDRE